MTMTAKPLISVAVIGHVDTGKSTILGHFQYKVGCVAQRTIEKLERESAELGKASFKFAWLTDSLREERERGISIDVSLSKVSTLQNVLTLVNTPGHVSFMKNAITGIAQADAAVLVVAADEAEFDAGFGASGQTREFALLAFTLGIKQLIVAVNKMDCESVAYNQARFETVERDVRTYLEQVGFDPSAVVAVPVSGWCGDNLADRSAHMPWYTGPTLLEAFDTFKAPRRAVDKPLRVTVQGSYKIGGIGTVVTGRVETGVLTPGMTITFVPTGVTGIVFSIERFHEAVSEALPGDSVGINLRGDVSHREIRRGHVASDAKLDPAKATVEFTAQLVILNARNEIRRGFSPIVHCHSAMVACRIKDITERIDRVTGDVVEKDPVSVKTGDACTVVLEPVRPVTVEAFQRYPALGRFAVRDMGTTIAVGVIKAVVKAETLTPKPVVQAAAARP